MSKFAWNLLKALPKPNKEISFREHLIQGMNACDLPFVESLFDVEVDGKTVDLGRLPVDSDMTHAWNLVAKTKFARSAAGLMKNKETIDDISEEITRAKQKADKAKQEKIKEKRRADKAEKGMYIAQKREAIAKKELEAAEKSLQRAKRQASLLDMTGDIIPSLLKPSQTTSRKNVRSVLPEVFTKCEISRVVQLPSLPNEDAIVSEIGQMLQEPEEHGKPATRGNENQTQQCAHSVLQTHVQIMEQIATRNRTSSGESVQFRVNKLFREAVDERQSEEEEDDSDYTGTGPNEHFPCFYNTLFYLQVTPTSLILKTGKAHTNDNDGTDNDDDKPLRAGVARLVARFMTKDVVVSTPKARCGLGVVSNSRDVVFVRVEMADDAIPVYVSEVVRLDSEQGLRYWARFMCCSATEQFGLSARNFLLKPIQQLSASSSSPYYSYVRALGSGSFADVVVVREVHAHEAEGRQQRELCCKVVRDGALHSHLLTHEARVLEKLQNIAGGIPKLVSCASYWTATVNTNGNQEMSACALLTSPVGTPLREHMKTLHGEGERHAFAGRVLEQLQAVLCAVHAKGIVHGDIKPDNLVVCANGEDVLLVDWGCAIIEQEEQARHKDFLAQVKEQEMRMNHITPFLSDELMRSGRLPTPQDDEIALLLTCLTLRESSSGCVPPWPYREVPRNPEKVIQARSQWLENYALTHPDLDLGLLLPCRVRIAPN